MDLPSILLPHRPTPLDYAVCFGNLLFVPLCLITPLTPTWRIIRAGVFAPLTASVFFYIIFSLAKDDLPAQWGSSALMIYFMCRCFSFFVFWPPEESCYRLVPAPAKPPTGTLKIPQEKLKNGYRNGDGNTQNGAAGDFPDDDDHRGQNGLPNGTAQGGDARAGSMGLVELVPEPVPQPWTLAKYYWASSLFWSWRGIGWNYSTPLPRSSTLPPYTRSSSRRRYLSHRVVYWCFTLLLRDAVMSFMTLSSASPFFLDEPGAKPYGEFTLWERTYHSLMIAGYVFQSLEESHVPCSIAFVALGGLFGWEGEIWSPWGWPPLFAGLSDLWHYPGLSYTWSRAWQQYFRNFLYQYGWLGIGENILGLPPSGPSIPTRSTSVVAVRTARISSPAGSSVTPSLDSTPLGTPGLSPTVSGRTSPTHPIPTAPSQSVKRVRIPRVLSDLLKSLIVFGLTGLLHDQNGGWLMLFYTFKGSPWLASTPSSPTLMDEGVLRINPNFDWREAIATTPFFILQPFALALEAIVKRQWRAWKVRRHPQWLERRHRHGHRNGTSNGISKKEPASGRTNQEPLEPQWLIFTERLIGFTWTWVWLGWSARWFVIALPRTGMFRQMDGQAERFSPIGGFFWGKWYH